jgi:TPR repeat protein
MAAPQQAAAQYNSTAAPLPPAHPQTAAPAQHHADDNHQQQQQQPVSLRLAVREAVSRWFLDTLAEAQRGDPKQQALLAAMYDQGYGCSRNPRAAREWAERAAQRGYRMSGVYCTNP